MIHDIVECIGSILTFFAISRCRSGCAEEPGCGGRSARVLEGRADEVYDSGYIGRCAVRKVVGVGGFITIT